MIDCFKKAIFLLIFISGLLLHDVHIKSMGQAVAFAAQAAPYVIEGVSVWLASQVIKSNIQPKNLPVQNTTNQNVAQEFNRHKNHVPYAALAYCAHNKTYNYDNCYFPENVYLGTESDHGSNNFSSPGLFDNVHFTATPLEQNSFHDNLDRQQRRVSDEHIVLQVALHSNPDFCDHYAQKLQRLLNVVLASNSTLANDVERFNARISLMNQEFSGYLGVMLDVLKQELAPYYFTENGHYKPLTLCKEVSYYIVKFLQYFPLKKHVLKEHIIESGLFNGQEMIKAWFGSVPSKIRSSIKSVITWPFKRRPTDGLYGTCDYISSKVRNNKCNKQILHVIALCNQGNLIDAQKLCVGEHIHFMRQIIQMHKQAVHKKYGANAATMLALHYCKKSVDYNHRKLVGLLQVLLYLDAAKIAQADLSNQSYLQKLLVIKSQEPDILLKNLEQFCVDQAQALSTLMNESHEPHNQSEKSKNTVVSTGGAPHGPDNNNHNYNNYHQDNKNNNQEKKSVEDILKDVQPGRQTSGKLKQFIKMGDYNQAVNDFHSLNPINIQTITHGLVGQLIDGRTINVRIKSSDKRPTLEIFNPANKKNIKIRYNT